MRRLLLNLGAGCLLFACSAPKEKIPPTLYMENKAEERMIIYQMMTRLFGNKNTTNKPFGTIEENGVGKFADINETALKSLKELGITHVWYTGVIEHAQLSDNTKFGIPLDDADVVKGRAGSPYSIKDYYDINPDLAVNVPQRIQEFEALVDRTHTQGLKVIIDFVPNHVARSYKSDAKPKNVKDLGADDDKSVAYSAKNNFYYLPGQSFTPPKGNKPVGNNPFPTLDGKFDETPAKVTANNQFTASPKITDWFEAVKLNYGVDVQGGKTYFDPVPDTWNKMKDILLYWTGKHVDGFRCDMAEMVPVEFWQWVIPQVKAVNPEVVFIAEIYNPKAYRSYINDGQFDFLYDKVQLYDTLRLLITGKRATSDIDEVQKSLEGINHKMLHFMENHDEQRIASKYFAGDPWKAAPAMVISATIDRGAVMIYFGQEVGEPALGNQGFQNSEQEGTTTKMDYWGVTEHQKWMNGGKFDGGLLTLEQKQIRQFYADVLNLARANVALTQGEYIDITAANIKAGNFTDKVHAFIRYSGEERLLILNSFNAATQNIKVQIPPDVVSRLQLDPNGSYIARDLLWREAEVGFGSTFTFELNLKPYSSYIFKIK
ncbi:MAG TPA: alpha-amylase family protein [Ohtaekwangia sp.]